MKSLQPLNCHTVTHSAEPAHHQIGTITDAQDGVYLIDHNVFTRSADGLGIELKQGDRVAYLVTADESFIVSLLVAAPRKNIKLDYPCAERLLVAADHIELIGRQSVSLRSLGDLSLETSRTIRLHCQHLLQTAIGSVVSVVGAWVQKNEQSSIETKGVMRSNAGSHIMTAQEDLRLDAKRINMG